MSAIRRRPTGSWFDPASVPALSAELAARLQRRMCGEKGVFLTLTYEREHWADARACFRASQQHQHVALFIRALERAIGQSLRGRWMCKLEFQRDGFPHWHLIIAGLRFVSVERVQEAWARGFVWVERCSPKHLTYLAKYVSKGGTVPAWVLAEPSRSVKVVRVSPGFWREDARPSAPSRSRRDGAICWPIWRPIAVVIEEARRTVQVCEEVDGSFRWRAVRWEFCELVLELLSVGYILRAVEGRRGWLQVVERIGESERVVSSERWLERVGGGRPPRSGGPPPVHLTTYRNPDSWLMPGLYELGFVA